MYKTVLVYYSTKYNSILCLFYCATKFFVAQCNKAKHLTMEKQLENEEIRIKVEDAENDPLGPRIVWIGNEEFLCQKCGTKFKSEDDANDHFKILQPKYIGSDVTGQLDEESGVEKGIMDDVSAQGREQKQTT